METEYEALNRGPALVDRQDRACLEVRGRDRTAWLHNLTTNHVKSLHPGQGTYAFALNVQGRILFDLNVICGREAFRLDLDRRFVDGAQSHFAKYTITEDVQVVDRTGDFVRLGLSGSGAVQLLTRLGFFRAGALPVLESTSFVLDGVSIEAVRTDFCGPRGFDLFISLNAAETIKQRLCDPSQECCAIEVGPEAVQIRRIEAGLPWPGYEITEDYLPAETRQMDRAVSLNKGCYLGQEVVERMRSRGQVARLLVGLVFDGSVNPEPGAELRCPDDKAIGTVTSVCRSPTRNVNLGLGYVRTAFSPPGTSVQAISGQGTFKATVEEIPFVNEPYD